MGAGIYFLIRDNVVIYVGKTLVWPKRLHFHITQGMDFTDVKFLKYPFDELDRWERAYIDKYKPEYNIHLKVKAEKKKEKLYSFRVGSSNWKKRVKKMRFRKLTKKSTIGFGIHLNNTVDYCLKSGKIYDLISIYFNCSHITFFDDILDELKIKGKWRIDKPGTDAYKFYEFMPQFHPALVVERQRISKLKKRAASKKIVQKIAVMTSNKGLQRDVNR